MDVLTALEFNSCLARNIQQIIHHRFDYRNPFFASDCLGIALRIAGDERAVGAGGGFGVAEDLNPFVDALSMKPSISMAPKKRSVHSSAATGELVPFSRLGGGLSITRRCTVNLFSVKQEPGES